VPVKDVFPLFVEKSIIKLKIK